MARKLLKLRTGVFDKTQDELVGFLGLTEYVHRGEISDFERGVREPDLLTLQAYADAAGITVDELIDDSVDLSEVLRAVAPPISSGVEPRGGPARAAMNTTVVTLRLHIKSAKNVAREEARARRGIEKNHLRQLEMKKVGDRDYELKLSYEDDEDLDERIYALLGAVKREAMGRGCSINVTVREKGTDRYW
jgi:transcriptional regulator with XRE-family HTH domain